MPIIRRTRDFMCVVYNICSCFLYLFLSLSLSSASVYFRCENWWWTTVFFGGEVGGVGEEHLGLVISKACGHNSKKIAGSNAIHLYLIYGRSCKQNMDEYGWILSSKYNILPPTYFLMGSKVIVWHRGTIHGNAINLPQRLWLVVVPEIMRTGPHSSLQYILFYQHSRVAQKHLLNSKMWDPVWRTCKVNTVIPSSTFISHSPIIQPSYLQPIQVPLKSYQDIPSIMTLCRVTSLGR